MLSWLMFLLASELDLNKAELHKIINITLSCRLIRAWWQDKASSVSDQELLKAPQYLLQPLSQPLGKKVLIQPFCWRKSSLAGGRLPRRIYSFEVCYLHSAYLSPSLETVSSGYGCSPKVLVLLQHSIHPHR